MHIHFKAYLHLKLKSGAHATFLENTKKRFFQTIFRSAKKRGCRHLNENGSSVMKKQKRELERNKMKR